jgi:hypothetical protein
MPWLRETLQEEFRDNLIVWNKTSLLCKNIAICKIHRRDFSMEVQLSCSALNCVHNLNGLCSANTIHVLGSGAHSSSQTMCNTFAEKGLKNAVTHLPNMNVAGEVRQLFTKNSIEMNPAIKCEAKNCKYNDNRVCHADYVQIHGPSADTSEGTVCETFNPSC